MTTPHPLTGWTLLLVASLTIMVGCVVAPGLPEIAAALGVSEHASFLITLPSLGVVVFGPLAAFFIQRTGLRSALMIGLVLYAVLGFSVLCLSGPLWIFLDRLLLGGATAIVMASGTGLLSSFYEGKARLTMIARQGMAIELGGVVLLAVGGTLASLHWSWPFGLYGLALVFLLLVLAFVPEAPELDEDTEGNVNAGKIPASLKSVYIAALLSMTCFFTVVIILPFSLKSLGLSATGSGYFLSFISLIAVVGAALMPRVLQRLGEQRTLALAFVGYALGLGILAATQSLGFYTAAAILVGLGFGFSVPLVNHMTIEQSHPAVRGKHLAYLSMAIFMGQFLSSFVESVPLPTQATFGLAALLALVSIGLLQILHQRQRKQHGAIQTG
ncbi:MFS transporter [Pokkaliibacter sp. CJK22405]|uniref:MFS transporter n=1 Tax=Pokkaliibacter sp. CJK22405 TaxID=3384615 RepID=UPI0039852385